MIRVKLTRGIPVDLLALTSEAVGSILEISATNDSKGKVRVFNTASTPDEKLDTYLPVIFGNLGVETDSADLGVWVVSYVQGAEIFVRVLQSA